MIGIASQVDNAGRRATFPTPVAPALTPPASNWPPKNYTECNTPSPGPPPPHHGPFGAVTCKPGDLTQEWLLSKGVVPGDGQITNVKMAAGSKGCWEITACAHGPTAGVGCGYGCKPLPKGKAPNPGGGDCNFNGAWATNKNGTITSAMDGNCLTHARGSGGIDVKTCTGDANQKFTFVVANASLSAYTIQQDHLCVHQG